jgi:hypothetical protein
MRIKHSAFAAASAVLVVLILAAPAFAAQGNNSPCLCKPAITPMNGTTRTVYVATVMYEDADGDVPAKVEVYIDGSPYPMRLAGGKAARGTYRARLTQLLLLRRGRPGRQRALSALRRGGRPVRRPE